MKERRRRRRGRKEDEKERTDETESVEEEARSRKEGRRVIYNKESPSEPLSERIVSSRHGKVSSADGRAVSILPIIVGLKGYLKKACIANSPPTCPITYEGPSRPLLPPFSSTPLLSSPLFSR